MATDKNLPVTIEGKVKQFWTGGKTKPRMWVTATMPFKDAIRIIRIDPFDAGTGKGIQRSGIDSWQKTLAKRMDGGSFTPNPWSAGVSKSHLKDVGPIEPGKTIKLVINPLRPLTSLDGQQRKGAMERLLKQYEADPERLKAIMESDIDFEVYLDPNLTYADFMNLNYGKPVDQSHMLSMELEHNTVDQSKAPYLKLAKETALIVNEDKDSPFFDRIKFDSTSVAPLALKSVLTLGGSDISTSIGGGAKLAMHFNKDHTWLASMYISAYTSIEKWGVKETVESELDDTAKKIPSVLRKGKLLFPRGKKGSSSLLIGIGNLLAYRMAKMGRDEVKPADAKHLVECVEDVFDHKIDGNLSGPDKRRMMGKFTDIYFADVTRRTEEDESNMKKMDALSFNGSYWPNELADLLSKSSLGIPKDAVLCDYGKKITIMDDEDEDDEETDDTDADDEEDDTDAANQGTGLIDDEEDKTEEDEDEFEPAPATPKGGKKGGKPAPIMG